MPLLSVRTAEGTKTIEFSPGLSLREILDTTDIRVRSGCRGNGSCGLCRVLLEEGEVSEPTGNERIHLTEARIRKGHRLACQTVPLGDARIVILNPAPPSQWKRITGEGAQRNHFSRAKTGIYLPGEIKKPFGVAVDIGTTHISLSLCDLLTGRRISDRFGLNPQAAYGYDIMSRLTAASESGENARRIREMGIAAIGDALLDMSSREGIDLRQVLYATLVGNTAMLALISGKNYQLLLQPSRWMEYIDCVPDDPSPWREVWGIHPDAVIETIPPLAGFVGSDLLAGIVSTRVTDDPSPSLFIDFGTNSEIALWNGRSFFVTSAAGGPAFESWGIGCGMPADSGAVYRVSLEGETLRYDTVDQERPKGFCGTGLVDLIASLLRLGKLTETGKFRGGQPQAGFTIAEGITLSPRDVDTLQRAKAAIGTAIEILLTEAGMGFADIGRVAVAGVFGRFLNVRHAREIGLLPPVESLRVELMGNTALAGCEDLLLSSEAADRLRDIRERAKVINLSQSSRFGDIFLKNLYLRPMAL